MLREKFKPQYNKAILSLPHCKLVIEKESREEWMGHLSVKVNESEYKEKDGRLKEQFIK